MATDPGMLGSWYQSYMKDKPATKSYAAVQADPTDWKVDTNQTVQGQMSGLLAKGSPLMQRAETRANQQSVQRGLLNSSMAVGAAQNAVIDAAMPMAQQDAGTYAESARSNAAARTSTSQFNAGETNTASRFGADAENQALTQQRNIGAEGVAREFDAGENAKQREFQTGERLGTQTFQTGERVGSQQFEAGERAADRTFTTGERLGAQTFQTGERTGAEAFQAGQNREQMTFQQRMQELQQAGSDAQQARDIASRESMTRLQEQGITNRFDQELAMRGEQFNVEQVAQDRRLAQQHQNTLAQMGYANTLNTQNVPANFAASVSSSTMDRVNAVLGDPNLDAAAKKAAVDNIVNYANNTISWAEKFYNVDLPSLTVPGATVASGGTLPPGVNPMPPPGKQLPTTTGPYPTPTSTYGPGWTGDTPQGPQVPQPYRPVWESTGA